MSVLYFFRDVVKQFRLNYDHTQSISTIPIVSFLLYIRNQLCFFKFSNIILALFSIDAQKFTGNNKCTVRSK